jgi:hypothetical protein
VSSYESSAVEESVQPVDDSSDEFNTTESIELQNKIAIGWQETETDGIS